MEKAGTSVETGNRPSVKNVRTEKEERLRIGICQGEGNEVQYEAIARLFADNTIFDSVLPFVYGSAPVLSAAGRNLGFHDMNPLVCRQIQDIKGKRLSVLTPDIESSENETAEPDTLDFLQAAVSHLKAGSLRALVTLPVSEEGLRQKHPEFKNQAMTVAQAFPGYPFRMLLCGSLRLSFLTTVRREDSETYLSRTRIEQRIRDLYKTLKNDFSITTPRIAVLGMNKDLQADRITLPDTQVIRPLIIDLFESGMPVFGPYPARSFLSSPDRNAFDAVLCMYKEQMEMVFETRSKEESCYYTAALPVVHIEPVFTGSDRESVFHSLLRSVFLAMDIDAARQQNRKLAEMPLGYTPLPSGRRDTVQEDDSPEKMFSAENHRSGERKTNSRRNPSESFRKEADNE